MRSSGRISAPCQAQARMAMISAKPKTRTRDARDERGGCSRSARETAFAGCVMGSGVPLVQPDERNAMAWSDAGLLLELGELVVDLAQLGLLLGRRHRLVVLDLQPVPEQRHLADRDELLVARCLEQAPLQILENLQLALHLGGILALARTAIIDEEGLDLVLLRLRQIGAPGDRIGRNQRRLPDHAHFLEALRLILL